MAGVFRNPFGRSVKKQWYMLYCIVLIIPLMVMLFSYHFSYRQLADAVYDRQMAHLTLVRDLVDAQARSISGTMMSFGVDNDIRKAAKVKDPAEEGKMPLFRTIMTDLNTASLNVELIDHYALYFPESEYLLDEGFMIPRRLIGWKDYSGAISENECAAILQQATTGQLNLLLNDQGNTIFYMKLSLYGSTNPLYAAAVLSTQELGKLLGNGTADEASVISIESLNGEIHLSNDVARAEAYAHDDSGWFHAEVASEVLPIRYVYASPTRIVEEKLTAYRYLTAALIALSLCLGGTAIFFAVRKQYAPVERLMRHFSSDQEQLENEYQNISDYLLQAQERNDHHFLVDVLQGNVSHSEAFPWQQLVLISPLDPEVLLSLSARQEAFIPSCRIVEMVGHVACIFQHEHHSEGELLDSISSLLPDVPVYIVYSLCDGQSLHRAYNEASDTLTTLRFFNADAHHVYHASPVAKEQTLKVMHSGFDEEFRNAILIGNVDKAHMLMDSTLRDLQENCRSGSLLRASLYAVSLLFMRLVASLRMQNPSIPDGVSGDIVRSYRYTSMDQLTAGAHHAIHDMIAALQLHTSRKPNTLYDQIDGYIRQHYCNPDLSVDMIASHLNFSAVYIRRVYKQGSGSGIPDAILHLRITAAKAELIQPGSRVNDVAQHVGFLDTGTFIRSFKKVEGMTPGAYKAQYQLQVDGSADEL